MKLRHLLTRRKKERVPVESPRNNPFHEAECARVNVDVAGEECIVVFRWIKNGKAEIKGAQADFLYDGSRVPVTVSAPDSDSFSVGISMAFPQEKVVILRGEVERLKGEGIVSSCASIGYNVATNQAILFRRAMKEGTDGDLSGWQSALDQNLQVLIDDFVGILPFVIRCFGRR